MSALLSVQVRTESTIRLPAVMTTLQYEGRGGRVDIADLTDTDLAAIGRAWTYTLLQTARERRPLPAPGFLLAEAAG